MENSKKKELLEYYELLERRAMDAAVSVRDTIDPPEGEGFSYGRMLTNMPEAGRRMRSDAYKAITSPLETMDRVRGQKLSIKAGQKNRTLTRLLI